jgi:O-antigen/teichoic acid export membrane protein
MLIYGLSYVPMLIALGWLSPLKLGFKVVAPRRDILMELGRFTLPIVIGHLTYIFYTSMDLIFLERFRGDTEVGVFGLLRQLSLVFTFISTGLHTIILPKVASAPGVQHRRMIKNALLMYGVVSGMAAVGFLIFYAPVVEWIWGTQYVTGFEVYSIYMLNAALLGVWGIFESALIGRGDADLSTWARVIGIVPAVLSGLWLVPTYGMAGTSLMMLIGGVVSLGVLAIFILMARRRSAQMAAQEEALPTP